MKTGRLAVEFCHGHDEWLPTSAHRRAALRERAARFKAKRERLAKVKRWLSRQDA